MWFISEDEPCTSDSQTTELPYPLTYRLEDLGSNDEDREEEDTSVEGDKTPENIDLPDLSKSRKLLKT